MKRIIAATLSFAIMFGLMTACTSEPKPVKTENTKAADTTSAETTQQHYTDKLETVDYSGEEFRVFTNNALNGTYLPTTQNYADIENGEVVNDALFARDIWMEENYKVSLKYTVNEGDVNQLAKTLVNGVHAGDDAYDVFIMDVATIAKAMTLNNCAYPLNYIKTINTGADYWMPELNDELMIGDNMYFTASAISPRYYGSVYIMMFNKDMAADLHIENMYDLVKNSKWTIDKMMEICRSSSADTNGNSVMDGDDRIGMLSDCVEGFVYGSNFKYIKNVDGNLVCQLKNENVISLLEKLAAFFEEPGIYDTTTKVFDSDTVLVNGNMLFYTPVTFQLAQFRDLEYDYGILPYPKLDENQEKYTSYSQPWATATTTIPVTLTVDSLERVGTLVDAMAAYGYDYIRPAVYENVIQVKGTRDEDSAGVVDLIFDNVTFELTFMLGGSALNSLVREYLVTKRGKLEITSGYAKVESVIDKEIEKNVNLLTEFAATLK